MATASIVVVGFAIGGTFGAAVMAGIGINLSSAIIQTGSTKLKEKWLSGNDGILNHDIQQALARAYTKTLGDLETSYFTLGEANALAKNEQKSIKELFRELREQAQATFMASIESSINEQEIQQYLYSKPEVATDKLWERIDATNLLYTYGEHFRDFLRKNLLNKLLFRFSEELKIDNKESNRAWRAFQRMLLDGIQANVMAVQAGQEIIHRDLQVLDIIRQQLDQLKNMIDSRLPYEPFQECLETGISEIHMILQDVARTTQRMEETVDTIAAGVKTLDNKVENSGIAWSQLLKALDVHVAHEPHTKPSSMPNCRLYFDHLIETHTRLFAGREIHLETILTFMETESGGYIFVEARSGYGKTSLLAKLVRENPHFAYHFISQAYKTYGSDFDPTEMESLLLNLCEQFPVPEVWSNQQLSPRARFHSLLRTPAVSGPRVIVIDAVDEIDKHPNYLLGLFPETLPPGIFVIFSARTLGDHDYLSEIGLKASHMGLTIGLPGLDETAIAQLLRLVGGKAIFLSGHAKFVKKLYQVSQGDPFYLRFLVEDIAQGTITSQNIDRVPSGMNEYLDTQLSILDKSAHLPQQRDILGIILEAYGPISRSDLINMVEGLDGLNFYNVLRDIQRFLLVYNNMYTFCHNRFKEYFKSKVL